MVSDETTERRRVQQAFYSAARSSGFLPQRGAGGGGEVRERGEWFVLCDAYAPSQRVTSGGFIQVDSKWGFLRLLLRLTPVGVRQQYRARFNALALRMKMEGVRRVDLQPPDDSLD